MLLIPNIPKINSNLWFLFLAIATTVGTSLIKSPEVITTRKHFVDTLGPNYVPWKQQFLQTKFKMEIKNPDFILEGILLWTVAFFSLAFIAHWTWNILCFLIDLDVNWKKLYLEILFSYRLYKFLFWIKKKLLGKHPKSRYGFTGVHIFIIIFCCLLCLPTVEAKRRTKLTEPAADYDSESEEFEIWRATFNQSSEIDEEDLPLDADLAVSIKFPLIIAVGNFAFLNLLYSSRVQRSFLIILIIITYLYFT